MARRRENFPAISKKFPELSRLVVHTRSHTLEKPFTCGLCGKLFKTQHNLKQHIYSHTMEKPFKCGQYGRGYTSNSYLQIHIRSVHVKEKNFFCQFCNYSSYDKSNFKKYNLLQHSTNIGNRVQIWDANYKREKNMSKFKQCT